MKSTETIGAPAREIALHQVEKSWSPYANTSVSTRARLRNLWAKLGFNHDVASKIRYEMDMLMLRIRCSLSPAYKRQLRDLAQRRHLLVHLGCGNALLPGWLNLDCYPPQPAKDTEILTLDVRRGLPLPTASAAALFSEHFLEHLPFETVKAVILPEIHRVLEPQGMVRIGIPNGEYFVDQYVAYRAGGRDPIFDSQRNNKTPMTMLNEIAHAYGHYFAYDFETFSNMLVAAGFENVRRCAPFDSTVDHFRGKDRVDEWRNAMTLYVEAEAASRPV